MTENRNTPLVVKHPVTNKLFDISALFSDDLFLMPDNDFTEVGIVLDNAIKFVSMNTKFDIESDIQEFQNTISTLFLLRDVFNQMKELKPVSE